MLLGRRNRTSLERYFPESRIFAVFCATYCFSIHCPEGFHRIRLSCMERQSLMVDHNQFKHQHILSEAIASQRSMPAVPYSFYRIPHPIQYKYYIKF